MKGRSGWAAAGMVMTAGLGMWLSGCSASPPTGQVIASVGADDVTKRDLSSEMQATGLAADADAPARAVLVDQLVDRTLLVQSARQRRIDRSPEYLAAVRRARSVLLATMLTDRIARNLPAPTAAEQSAYVGAHPWMFGARQLIAVDVLDTRGGGRRRATLDTGAMTAADGQRLARATGAPVQLHDPDRLVVVQGRAAAPIVGDQATVLAAALMRRQRLVSAIDAVIATQRRQSPVRFQQGFGPAAQ